uniref:Interferon-induced transmembrane protein n=1 Tax=Syphacia muris TaxID=451379 RepID=A0A0N5AVN1_9BILA
MEETKKNMQIYNPHIPTQQQYFQQQQSPYYYFYQMQFQKSNPEAFLPSVNMMPPFWNLPTASSSEIAPYQFPTVVIPFYNTHYPTDFCPFSLFYFKICLTFIFLLPVLNKSYYLSLLQVKKKAEKKASTCSHIFCGGIAQLLWIIVGIVIAGMTAALILALMLI